MDFLEYRRKELEFDFDFEYVLNIEMEGDMRAGGLTFLGMKEKKKKEGKKEIK